MAGVRGIKWSTAEKRARKTIEKEQRRIDMKRRVNLMHADGYPVVQIAEFFGLSEGTVRHMISVNGGY